MILIVGASSNPGGIEAFLKNNLEKFNKEKYNSYKSAFLFFEDYLNSFIEY